MPFHVGRLQIELNEDTITGSETSVMTAIRASPSYTIARDQHSRVGWVRPVADRGAGVTKGEFYCDPVEYRRHGQGKIIYQGECFFKVHFPHRSLYF